MKEEIHDVEKISKQIGLPIKDILEYQIYSVGRFNLSVYEVLAALLCLIFGWFISRFVRYLVHRSRKLEVSKKFAITQILHYIIVFITFILVMKSLGVNISPLLLGSSAILVGIGLGLQNLFLDFISGVIILLDGSIKVGDVIEVGGIIGKVEEIKMRTTTVLTRDNRHMVFPNSLLTKDKFINFSHDDDIVVFNIIVGVHYDTDIDLAEKLLLEAAQEVSDVLFDEKHQPMVRFDDFAESSINLKLFYHSRNLFRQPKISSDIRKSVLQKFRNAEINIPYPTRTLEYAKNPESNGLKL